jgi:hypothetical protein
MRVASIRYIFGRSFVFETSTPSTSLHVPVFGLLLVAKASAAELCRKVKLVPYVNFSSQSCLVFHEGNAVSPDLR